MSSSVEEILSLAKAMLVGRTDSPQLDAEVLLTFVTGENRSRFRAFGERHLPAGETRSFLDLVRQRAEGRPIAYLTGSREFWSRTFEVSDAVLIPRPETETLVETALTALRDHPGPEILDLGTGSGAVAVTLALECPDAWLVASDQSPEALSLAQKNAIRHGVAARIRFFQGDWFGALPDLGPFDAIVCNPPYLPDLDPHLDRGDLRFEPRTALASGPLGLTDLERIIRDTPGRLNPDGILALEHGFDQGEPVRQLLAAAGFQAIRTRRDLAGHPRVTLGRAPRP